jgi:hypothetical protein
VYPTEPLPAQRIKQLPALDSFVVAIRRKHVESAAIVAADFSDFVRFSESLVMMLKISLSRLPEFEICGGRFSRHLPSLWSNLGVREYGRAIQV